MSVAPTCNCPAELFAYLWGELIQADSVARLRALPSSMSGVDADPFDALNAAIQRALLNRDGVTVAHQLQDLLKQCEASGSSLLPSQIRVMLALNKQFRMIHPRSAVLQLSGHKARPTVPEWLKELRSRRQDKGTYASFGNYYVVPRGPLTRHARGETASSANDPYDMFDTLSAVRRKLAENERPIHVDFRVIGNGGSQGVLSNAWPGNEFILFAPVAEQASHLNLTPIERDGQPFVSIDCAAGFCPSKRLLDVLEHAKKVDVAIAPEFVMPEQESNIFSQNISALTTTSRPRVTILGSGSTDAKTNSQSWNESRGVNSIGAELWRQRKIWPAGISASRAIELGLPDPGDGMLTEDIGCGDSLSVIDIDGFGRCVTLICQDLHLHPMVEEVLKGYQPDWVFVPILDKDLETGRWAHQRAFALSELSHARFLVANSSSLGQRLGVGKTHACGLAVGPKGPTRNLNSHTDDHEGRQIGVVTVTVDGTPGAAPVYGIIEWHERDSQWDTTKLTAQ